MARKQLIEITTKVDINNAVAGLEQLKRAASDAALAIESVGRSISGSILSSFSALGAGIDSVTGQLVKFDEAAAAAQESVQRIPSSLSSLKIDEGFISQLREVSSLSSSIADKLAKAAEFAQSLGKAVSEAGDVLEKQEAVEEGVAGGGRRGSAAIGIGDLEGVSEGDLRRRLLGLRRMAQTSIGALERLLDEGEHIRLQFSEKFASVIESLRKDIAFISEIEEYPSYGGFVAAAQRTFEDFRGMVDVFREAYKPASDFNKILREADERVKSMMDKDRIAAARVEIEKAAAGLSSVLKAGTGSREWASGRKFVTLLESSIGVVEDVRKSLEGILAKEPMSDAMSNAVAETIRQLDKLKSKYETTYAPLVEQFNRGQMSVSTAARQLGITAEALNKAINWATASGYEFNKVLGSVVLTMDEASSVWHTYNLSLRATERESILKLYSDMKNVVSESEDAFEEYAEHLNSLDVAYEHVDEQTIALVGGLTALIRTASAAADPISRLIQLSGGQVSSFNTINALLTSLGTNIQNMVVMSAKGILDTGSIVRNKLAIERIVSLIDSLASRLKAAGKWTPELEDGLRVVRDILAQSEEKLRQIEERRVELLKQELELTRAKIEELDHELELQRNRFKWAREEGSPTRFKGIGEVSDYVWEGTKELARLNTLVYNAANLFDLLRSAFGRTRTEGSILAYVLQELQNSIEAMRYMQTPALSTWIKQAEQFTRQTGVLANFTFELKNMSQGTEAYRKTVEEMERHARGLDAASRSVYRAALQHKDATAEITSVLETLDNMLADVNMSIKHYRDEMSEIELQSLKDLTQRIDKFREEARLIVAANRAAQVEEERLNRIRARGTTLFEQFMFMMNRSIHATIHWGGLFSSVIATAWDVLMHTARMARESVVGNVAVNMFDKFTQSVSAFAVSFANTMSGVTLTAEGVAAKLAQMFATGLNHLMTDTVPAFVLTMNNAFAALEKAGHQAAMAIMDFFNNLPGMVASVGDYFVAASNTFHQFVDAINIFSAQSLPDFAIKLIDLLGVAHTVLSPIVDIFTNKLPAAISQVGSAFADLGGTFSSVANAVSGAFSSIPGLLAHIPDVANTVVGAIAGIPVAINNFMLALYSSHEVVQNAVYTWLSLGQAATNMGPPLALVAGGLATLGVGMYAAIKDGTILRNMVQDVVRTLLMLVKVLYFTGEAAFATAKFFYMLTMGTIQLAKRVAVAATNVSHAGKAISTTFVYPIKIAISPVVKFTAAINASIFAVTGLGASSASTGSIIKDVFTGSLLAILAERIIMKVVWQVRELVRSFIDANITFQEYQARMAALIKGNVTFTNEQERQQYIIRQTGAWYRWLQQVISETAFEQREILETLPAFMRFGFDPTEWMRPMLDVAAALGVEMTRVLEALTKIRVEGDFQQTLRSMGVDIHKVAGYVRELSDGTWVAASRSEIFDEATGRLRDNLERHGYVLRKLVNENNQLAQSGERSAVVFLAWAKQSGMITGSAVEMSKTLKGVISNFKDLFDRLAVALGEGLFSTLAKILGDIYQGLTKYLPVLEKIATLIGNFIANTIGRIWAAIKASAFFVRAFERLVVGTYLAVSGFVKRGLQAYLDMLTAMVEAMRTIVDNLLGTLRRLGRGISSITDNSRRYERELSKEFENIRQDNREFGRQFVNTYVEGLRDVQRTTQSFLRSVGTSVDEYVALMKKVGSETLSAVDSITEVIKSIGLNASKNTKEVRNSIVAEAYRFKIDVLRALSMGAGVSDIRGLVMSYVQKFGQPVEAVVEYVKYAMQAAVELRNLELMKREIDAARRAREAAIKEIEAEIERVQSIIDSLRSRSEEIDRRLEQIDREIEDAIEQKMRELGLSIDQLLVDRLKIDIEMKRAELESIESEIDALERERELYGIKVMSAREIQLRANREMVKNQLAALEQQMRVYENAQRQRELFEIELRQRYASEIESLKKEKQLLSDRIQAHEQRVNELRDIKDMQTKMHNKMIEEEQARLDRQEELAASASAMQKSLQDFVTSMSNLDTTFQEMERTLSGSSYFAVPEDFFEKIDMGKAIEEMLSRFEADKSSFIHRFARAVNSFFNSLLDTLIELMNLVIYAFGGKRDEFERPRRYIMRGSQFEGYEEFGERTVTDRLADLVNQMMDKLWISEDSLLRKIPELISKMDELITVLLRWVNDVESAKREAPVANILFGNIDVAKEVEKAYGFKPSAWDLARLNIGLGFYSIFGGEEAQKAYAQWWLKGQHLSKVAPKYEIESAILDFEAGELKVITTIGEVTYPISRFGFAAEPGVQRRVFTGDELWEMLQLSQTPSLIQSPDVFKDIVYQDLIEKYNIKEKVEDITVSIGGLTKQFKVNMDEVAEAMATMYEEVSGSAGRVGMASGEMAQKVSENLKEIDRAAEALQVGDILVEKFVAAGERLYGHSVIPEMIEEIKRLFNDLVNEMNKLAAQITEPIVSEFNNLSRDIMPALDNVWQAVLNSISTAIYALQTSLGVTPEMVQGAWQEVTSFLGLSRRDVERIESIFEHLPTPVPPPTGAALANTATFVFSPVINMSGEVNPAVLSRVLEEQRKDFERTMRDFVRREMRR